MPDQTTKTKEERIREYAYSWYQFRVLNRRPGDAKKDWERAEHMVDAEDTIKC